MVINMEEKTVIRFIGELCSHAGESGEFAENFWQRLKNDREIYVMVWQMDHFKARLDADNSNMRQNGDRMILLAFDTLLCMRTEPDKYIYRMQSETGTDYPGKY